MRWRGRLSGIRAQLLVLFGLVMLAAGSVIVADELMQRRQLAVLERLNVESFATLAHTKALSDAYAVRIGGTTFQVRNRLMDWDVAERVVDTAAADIAARWEALDTLARDQETAQFLALAQAQRGMARATVLRLQEILENRDEAALEQFSDSQLFPSLQPALFALNTLSEIELARVDEIVRQQARASRRTSVLRISLSLAVLVLVALLGSRILRNVYRGVESLNSLALGVKHGDLDSRPAYTPRGELGRVQDTLLEMRRSVQDNEQTLARQLQRNEEVLQQLRDSQARAQAANLAKSDFLATMSHEIRTPMIGVVGMLDVLSQSRLDGEQRRCVNVIEQSAESLLQVLGDILDFSKIEAGRLTLDLQGTDLAALVRSTVANFQGAASSKGLVLDCRVAPGLAPGHEVDALRVRQILANLVSNAVKFTDVGNVDVVLECEPPREGTQRVRLRVEDTGIGVAPEAQATLFTAFTQAQEGPAGTRRPGTGLGLAICRRLARLMDGEVEMESAPGQGTRMRFEFEARTSDQPAAALPVGEGRMQRFGRRFIARDMPDLATAERERSLVLLVDDHPTNRQVIARQLALAGFATQSASDGDEGLALWRSGRFALVITDVHMPRMNGYELARSIREAEAGEGRERTPVIALTAAALKGEAERCLAAGMDDYLAKPVSIATLSERMHRWLPHLGTGPHSAGKVSSRKATRSTPA